MLKTALKAQWITIGLLTLVVVVIFSWLGKWQLDQSVSEEPPPREQTENPVPLTEHFDPGHPMYGYEADQMVTLTGQIDPEATLQVHPRLFDGEEGYWLVSSMSVGEGESETEQDAQIPVVLGWSAEPFDEGNHEELTQLLDDVANIGSTDGDTSTRHLSDTQIEATGRLLPAEAPQGGDTDRSTTPISSEALATAELVNIWDRELYAGFVVVEEFTVVDGPTDQDPQKFDGVESIKPVTSSPQPEETEVVWLNIFYAVEWIVFAVMAIYLYWRVVRDDHLKDQREAALDEEWEQQWKAEELQRRREEARVAKAQAVAEYRNYYGTEPDASQRPEAPDARENPEDETDR